ncbi:FAR1 DNA binding domain-containing protein [Artemisia annua]|uniref:FAR1 DNA binding domain-containing protein n=1 Tax=Artemisia annua TaxID=35608 RepID=A0A2U1L986_ARTAN|nr:FAR1 DNA binding domain-containing protein [Artemisia annua]
MSNVTNESDSIQGQTANPPSCNIVQDDIIGDDQSVPQVGSYQRTPPGSKFWIPDAKNKPVEGTEFDTIELALKFYKEYAREGGFEVRRGGKKKRKTKEDPTLKYFVCSKEGVKPPPKNDKKTTDMSQSDNIQIVKQVIKRRRRASQRCGCKAILRLRQTEENKYVVYTFFEKHNHPLVQENDYKYLRAARKLSFPKQQLLYHLSNANLGPTRAWKVMKEMFGGFENIEAADLYTITLFYDVQDEILSSLMHCCSLSVTESDTFSTFVIRDTEADYKIKDSQFQVKYEVKYVPSECSFQCSCLRYECYGLLCRHIFYVMRMSKVDHFPKNYLQKRWSKNALRLIHVAKRKDDASPFSSEAGVDSVLREIYNNVEVSVSHLVGDMEKLQIYRDGQTLLMEKAKLDVPNTFKINTNDQYAKTLGVTEPAHVDILVPTDINNKGGIAPRVRTRRKSKSEIAMKLAEKPKRLCKTCHKYSNHDSRNCPTKRKGLQDHNFD